jgi:chromosome segregation ATPase
MTRLKDAPSRTEIEGKIEKTNSEMEEKGEVLDKIASDIETVRHTFENLDMGGTKEGTEKLESSFENTEKATTEVFEEKDDELERVHQENNDFEGEIEGRRNSSESDLEKISDATAKIETSESIDELLKAKETGLEEIDFLKNQIEHVREAMEKSESTRERHKSRIHTGRRR